MLSLSLKLEKFNTHHSRVFLFSFINDIHQVTQQYINECEGDEVWILIKNQHKSLVLSSHFIVVLDK